MQRLLVNVRSCYVAGCTIRRSTALHNFRLRVLSRLSSVPLLLFRNEMRVYHGYSSTVHFQQRAMTSSSSYRRPGLVHCSL